MLALTLVLAAHALAAPCRFDIDSCKFSFERRSWQCVYSLHHQGRRLGYFYDPGEALDRARQLTYLKICDDPPSLPGPPEDPVDTRPLRR